MEPINIIGYVCLGICWGPSTIIGCYKCCKYCESEEGKSDSAQAFSVTTYRQNPYTGKRENVSTYVSDPSFSNGLAKFCCWSLGAPISTVLFSKEIYNNYTFKRDRDRLNNNNIVTTQPQLNQIDNMNQKY